MCYTFFMIYVSNYNSPVGQIGMASDGESLIGLWIEGQKHFCKFDKSNFIFKDLPIHKETKNWLNIYFSGKCPDWTPKLLLKNISAFRESVCKVMQNIPFGKTITYGEIAKQIECKTGKKVSAQAVGGAVGHNPISIIIPCHRVVGANGNLTGYAGGIDKKVMLLENEGVNMSGFFVPFTKRG